MKKFFLSILTITVAALFCMSGCTAPTSEAGTPAHKETGKMILTAGEANGIRLTTFAAGTTTSESDSGYTIKAKVEPSSADNIRLIWGVSWVDKQASWVQALDEDCDNPSDYVKVQETSADGHEVQVSLLEDFGAPIFIRAVTADSYFTSKEISASIIANCVQRISEVDLFSVTSWWEGDYNVDSSEITTQISQDSYFDRGAVQNITNYIDDGNHMLFLDYTVPDAQFSDIVQKIEIKYEQKHLDALMEWCPTFATAETIQSGWVEMTTSNGLVEDGMCLTGSEDYALLWATSNSLDSYDAYIASSKINVVAACRESAGEKYATVRYTRYGVYSTYVQEYNLYFNSDITISTTNVNIESEGLLL